MKRLAIIGSGDLGHQIAYHAKADKHYEPVGFFDDYQPVGSIRHELPVMGGVNDIVGKFNDGVFDCLMIAIGYKHMAFRMSLYRQFIDHVPFGTIIHSSAYIDKSCTIAPGTIVYPGCVLDMNVVLGGNVLLNAGCVIAHDTAIGESCFLSPGVKVAGFVKTEPGVILGIGTTVIDNILIKSGVRTGGGAVVIDDLEQPGLYAGVPAKLKKTQ